MHDLKPFILYIAFNERKLLSVAHKNNPVTMTKQFKTRIGTWVNAILHHCFVVYVTIRIIKRVVQNMYTLFLSIFLPSLIK